MAPAPRRPTGNNNQLGQILLLLGELRGDVEGIKTDIQDGKESRQRLHTKLERIQEDVRIVGAVATQARTQLETLDKIVMKDIKPSSDEFRRMKTIGFVGLSLVGFAFTALGVTLATVGEGVVQAIRHWLKIV